MIWGHLDLILAQNFGAILAGIVISAGVATFEICCKDA